MTDNWNQLATSIDAASSAALGFKAEYDTLQEQLAATKASLNEAIKSNATLVIQRDEAVRDVNDLNGVVHDQTTQIELLTTQRRQLRATVALYTTQIATLQTRIAELEAQIPAKRCTLPIWETNVQRGTDWVKPGNANVRVLNEVWNTKEAGPQTLKVCSASSWYVNTNQPKVGVPADRKGAVKSYPCTQVLLASKPALGSIISLNSSWAHEAPKKSGYYWDVCYDMWIGGLGSASTAEVMIWTDLQYPGPLPPSNALKTATLELDGRTYKAWTRKNSNQGDYIALVETVNRPTGSVNLLAVFKWLISLGWLKATDTLAAVNYGIELSNTEFTPASFYLNDFKLEYNGAQMV